MICIELSSFLSVFCLCLILVRDPISTDESAAGEDRSRSQTKNCRWKEKVRILRAILGTSIATFYLGCNRLQLSSLYHSCYRLWNWFVFKTWLIHRNCHHLEIYLIAYFLFYLLTHSCLNHFSIQSLPGLLTTFIHSCFRQLIHSFIHSFPRKSSPVFIHLCALILLHSFDYWLIPANCNRVYLHMKVLEGTKRAEIYVWIQHWREKVRRHVHLQL